MAHFLIMVGIAFDVFFVIIGGGSSCGFGVRVVVALYKGSESVSFSFWFVEQFYKYCH